MKGKIIEEEDIKTPNCSRKSHVDVINEEMKGSSSEEEDIRCSKKPHVETLNE